MADEECYQAIANRVQIALVMLKAEVDGVLGDIQPLGVLPGVLGPFEPSPRLWVGRLRSPEQGLFASLAAAQASADYTWRTRSTRPSALPTALDVGLLDASATYALARTAEVCRILAG
eukprot:jgi/Tetstr1/445103/TSEL_032901.t1